MEVFETTADIWEHLLDGGQIQHYRGSNPVLVGLRDGELWNYRDGQEYQEVLSPACFKPHMKEEESKAEQAKFTSLWALQDAYDGEIKLFCSHEKAMAYLKETSGMSDWLYVGRIVLDSEGQKE